MIEIERPADMAKLVGQKLGTSDWLTVDQRMIGLFAEATGDHQWIHVDTERAKRELPGGRTIAHGYLTLSLIPRLMQSVFRIRHRARGVNYGCNRVRFTAPVPSGARIRLHLTLKAAEPVPGGMRATFENTVEIEGETRPAVVAETISVSYE